MTDHLGVIGEYVNDTFCFELHSITDEESQWTRPQLWTIAIDLISLSTRDLRLTHCPGQEGRNRTNGTLIFGVTITIIVIETLLKMIYVHGRRVTCIHCRSLSTLFPWCRLTSLSQREFSETPLDRIAFSLMDSRLMQIDSCRSTWTWKPTHQVWHSQQPCRRKGWTCDLADDSPVNNV